MNRRWATIILAGFYLLQSTWLLHAGVDLLFPRVRPAATASSSCCNSGCGCSEEQKAARDCCCMKHTKAEPASKPAQPSSSIEEAKCKGVQDALSQALTQPAVCTFAHLGAPIWVTSDQGPATSHPAFAFVAVSLEKVPIAQA